MYVLLMIWWYPHWYHVLLKLELLPQNYYEARLVEFSHSLSPPPPPPWGELGHGKWKEILSRSTSYASALNWDWYWYDFTAFTRALSLSLASYLCRHTLCAVCVVRMGSLLTTKTSVKEVIDSFFIPLYPSIFMRACPLAFPNCRLYADGIKRNKSWPALVS